MGSATGTPAGRDHAGRPQEAKSGTWQSTQQGQTTRSTEIASSEAVLAGKLFHEGYTPMPVDTKASCLRPLSASPGSCKARATQRLRQKQSPSQKQHPAPSGTYWYLDRVFLPERASAGTRAPVQYSPMLQSRGCQKSKVACTIMGAQARGMREEPERIGQSAISSSTYSQLFDLQRRLP